MADNEIRMVQCVVLKTEAEGLDKPPHPGELGQRIYLNVSKEGWQQWLERAKAIINENGLSTANASNIIIIEKHMLGFFFGEGDFGQLPAGFQQGGGGKK
ncbi:oxidative damage protection protein [sulfur-oxidizing endosymbiont of Gigantopelta aegis]|uniref:oxidative damage protection protein n=1 Tax=sulfur-oxidizing endosymbiont of Gigantopelta aegis TaxID=2794934 RepID=UPI0018DB3F46|nr:oxidative damage protection protein [sulfur-oxidizing endosymbiont of Gigantopelta aegis]